MFNGVAIAIGYLKPVPAPANESRSVCGGLPGGESTLQLFTGTTCVTVIDKGKLKQRTQFIDDKMMHHPVAKVGGKYFSLYGFIDNKGNGLARLVSAVIDFSTKFQQIGFIIDLKSEGIEGVLRLLLRHLK